MPTLTVQCFVLAAVIMCVQSTKYNLTFSWTTNCSSETLNGNVAQFLLFFQNGNINSNDEPIARVNVGDLQYSNNEYSYFFDSSDTMISDSSGRIAVRWIHNLNFSQFICCWSVSNFKIYMDIMPSDIVTDRGICYIGQAYWDDEGMLSVCSTNPSDSYFISSTYRSDNVGLHQVCSNGTQSLIYLEQSRSTSSSVTPTTNSSQMTTVTSPMTTSSSPMTTITSTNATVSHYVMATITSTMATSSSSIDTSSMVTSSTPKATSSTPMATSTSSSVTPTTNSSTMATSSSSIDTSSMVTSSTPKATSSTPMATSTSSSVTPTTNSSTMAPTTNSSTMATSSSSIDTSSMVTSSTPKATSSTPMATSTSSSVTPTTNSSTMAPTTNSSTMATSSSSIDTSSMVTSSTPKATSSTPMATSTSSSVTPTTNSSSMAPTTNSSTMATSSSSIDTSSMVTSSTPKATSSTPMATSTSSSVTPTTNSSTMAPTTNSSTMATGSSSIDTSSMVTSSTPKATSSTPMATSTSSSVTPTTNSSTMAPTTNSSTMATSSSSIDTSSMVTSSTPKTTSSTPMATSSRPMEFSSSVTSSSIRIDPTSLTNNDLMCPVDPKEGWPLTKAGTNANVTNSRICYNGTANATRLCGLNGEWHPHQCIVSDLFIVTLNQIKESPEEGIKSINSLSQNISLSSNEVPINQFIYLLNEVLEAARQSFNDLISPKVFAQAYLETSNNLFDQLNANTNLVSDPEVQRSEVSQLIRGLDDLALNFIEPSKEVRMISVDLLLRVIEFDQSLHSNVTGNITGIGMDGNLIELPRQILVTNLTKPIRIGSFFYRNLSSLLPPRDNTTSIISPVISSTTNCQSCPVTDLHENVTIQLHIEMMPSTSDNVSCVFFQFERGDWNTSGCTTTINGSMVTCSCNHLTHFAILLSPGLKDADPIHYEILSTIGLILIPISLLCMIIVILTFTLIRSLWSIRNYIHVMLCVSLSMAQLVFIIGVDKIKNEGACSAIAVLLQYLFLVSFMWMLMEGVVLYVTLVRVFIDNHKYYIIAFTLTSYLIPAVYMMLIVPIGYLVKVGDISGHTHYLYYNDGDLTACWLSYESSFIWSFIVPVAIILLVNIGFFVMAIVIMKKHSKKMKNRRGSIIFKHWLKASISLTLVMGITWLAGLLAFRKELLFVAYIMTVFIAGQGLLLFIILVPLSKQVRDAYVKIWLKQKSQSSILTKLSGITTASFFSTDTLGRSKGLPNANGKTNGHSGGIKLGTFDNNDSFGTSTMQSINGNNDIYSCIDKYGANSSKDTPHLAELIDQTYEPNPVRDTRVDLAELMDNNYEVDPKYMKKQFNDVIINNDHAISDNENETAENEYESVANLYETVIETPTYKNVADCDNVYSTCDFITNGQ